MHVRFVLGPAGCGKTRGCLKEIREVLSRSPEGPPLILIAPNQATYQLERQVLEDRGVQGYTRLHVLSFERLAHLLFDWFGEPSPELLDEEGRVMVLRAVLARKHKELKLFRASARLTGFAQQLSNVLRSFQQNQFTPESLNQLAQTMAGHPSLACKLQDFATLLEEYSRWLAEDGLQDSDCLLSNAAALVREKSPGASRSIKGIWVDGFAEFTRQELELMAALLPLCRRATLTFCLENLPQGKSSWISSWSVGERNFEAAREHLAQVAGAELICEALPRDPQKNRFQGTSVLRHLEEHWANPVPLSPSAGPQAEGKLRVVSCADPAAEAVFAAREILCLVREGGHRFRDVAVLVRNLEDYHQEVQRVFARYEIPFFLDRRESTAHHPLAELTRSAVRTVALGWQHEDWFASLKTGLTGVADEEIDELENEALARGWRGGVWQQPLRIRESARSQAEEERLRQLETRLENLRQKLVTPFQSLGSALKGAGNQPTGTKLAAALRDFWEALHVSSRLQEWTARDGAAKAEGVATLHQTVLAEMNSWLENIELAFSDESLPLREWLPILEAGLANLTVGQIPPALDQVLVGAVDRSRNPEVAVVILLGLNESIFPAAPESGGLLTDADRADLENANALPACTPRQQLSRERHFGYIACTRARQRLVLTYSLRSRTGKLLNASPFLGRIRQLFPAIPFEVESQLRGPDQCVHTAELMEAVMPGAPETDNSAPVDSWRHLLTECNLGGMAASLEKFQGFNNGAAGGSISPGLAERLYGPVLRTSISRMEQFAACPFKFFVHSGLRAQERKRFELDAREQGSFQHDVLAIFHEQLSKEGKKWKDITPEEAKDRVGRIAKVLMAGYREGLLEATEQTRFMVKILTESLQEFVAILVGWMRDQYAFEPHAVELPFGTDEKTPPWALNLSSGHKLELYGRIDRVDLLPLNGGDEALCVIVDYKSSHKQLDAVFMANGLQLQLPAYLNVMRRWEDTRGRFGLSRLIPAGMFYVNLRGKSGYEQNRSDALEEADRARRLAYRHSGRFDASVVKRLDCRTDVQQGDQFNFRVTKTGALHKACREPLTASEFTGLLDSVEDLLREMGDRIYSGVAGPSPYRKGSVTACQQCDYQSICRIDPWTHPFRALRLPIREAALT